MTTQPVTRAENFTFPELAEALETAPSDNASTHMLYLAPLQAWAVCAAMWREVARARGVITFTGNDDIALEHLAMRWQALAATALEGRPGLWGATRSGRHPFQASPQQAAVIADALREYAEDLHILRSPDDGEPCAVFKTTSVPAAEEIGTLMRAANRVLDGIAPKAAPTLPATRSPDFTLPDLADALEHGPSDFDFGTPAHEVAPAQRWAICAAMWREVDRRGAETATAVSGVTLHQLARALQELMIDSYVDHPTAEHPAGRLGTGGMRLYLVMAAAPQMATIATALRSYADDFRPRTIISGGQHPAEPPEWGDPIWRRQTLVPWPEGTMPAATGRFQAPGRDLEDDGA